MDKKLLFYIIFILIMMACRNASDNMEIIDKHTDTPSLPSNSLAEIVDGYTNKISYFPEEECEFYINSKLSGSQTFVLRDINGVEVDRFVAASTPQNPQGLKPWEDGFGYKLTFKEKLPALKSGIYFLNEKIPLLIKSSTAKPITVLYPSNTVNAYNNAGGKNSYTKGGKASVISFKRPVIFSNSISDPSYETRDFFKWLVSKNYDVNFICDQDMDDYQLIKDTKVLIVTGHSEYWTRKARENFDSLIDSGGNAVVLSGNSMWWQVRYSDDGSQMICYKYDAKDPIDNTLLSTVSWRDDSLKYPIVNSIGADFDNGGYGLGADEGWDGYKIVDESSPLLFGTGLKNGDIISLPSIEYDGAPTIISNNIPQLDNKKLSFFRSSLIGYDFGTRDAKKTVGTFVLFQKSISSGILINGGSTDWCSTKNFSGRSGALLKKITANMIDLLIAKKSLF